MKTVEQQLSELSKLRPSPESLERGRNIVRRALVEDSRDIVPSAPLSRDGLIAQPLLAFRSFLHNVATVYYSHIITSLVITVLFFGAFGAYAGFTANQSLPNEAPYPLKKALEHAQLTLRFSEKSKAELRVALLRRRLYEFDAVIRRTSDDSERSQSVAVKAIQDARHEATAVKDSLAELAREEEGIAAGIVERIGVYHIAVNEAQEYLSEPIREQLQPEIDELNSTLLAIEDIIGLSGSEEVLGVSVDEEENILSEDTSEQSNGLDSEDSLDDVFMGVSTSTTITSTDIIIGTVLEGLPVSDELSSFDEETVIEEEEWTIEKDTFKVHIGD